MNIYGSDTSLLDWTGDTVAIGLFENEINLIGELDQLNNKTKGTLQELIDETKFEGKVGRIIFTRLGGSASIRKILLVGLGKSEEFTLNSLRLSIASVARFSKKEHIQTLCLQFPIFNNNPSLTAEVITEGLLLSLHQDNRFKSNSDDKLVELKTIDILGIGEQKDAISRAQIICSGVIMARELVNAPANYINPITFTEVAKKLANEYDLEIEILEQDECAKLGMGAFLGVAQASDLPPKFIHLTYKSKDIAKRKIAIIGKSLTFDSGGLNLKGSSSGIEVMKMDMGGGAATLGVAKAIAQLKPNIEVHFICAVTENMISGCAIHPGDVLTASNGKTIEVNNTDAEGRLTLADALVFAEKLEVDSILDIATLTGACIVALGDNISGLWSTDNNLINEIKIASEKSGEQFWQMPMEDKYFEGLKSSIADMKNTGPRAGGSITAALFLKQFVEKTPWLHLDIAGTAWIDKENGVNNAGATGVPVRTIVNWLTD
ncbi:leucyl aminopeptidase [Candidatus Atelocyanobacterium thalassae]|uniref:Probable cytosol aminopeptidase n=1 Tax=Atelocyanobacterium thalassa (isolate ALOHA) TaxID=1453429 RepID=D3EQL7_ATETH|nr:leucyl aminopeptidase [Candidatus Atelocyanobacterium thalassa]ADB95767.1 leucyl aminopeptidase [Candidatus Atelocyanobacterium thalassa isolate ALOHA]MCH2543014.1 leucyl aminopeptidase [Candidatus Atelocyanobacterium sp. ALOHA_A2.5_9]|tara:strand:- start:1008 stop:2480 length:1473 start_codon:yes stop_codon:yes gene_type:complete